MVEVGSLVASASKSTVTVLITICFSFVLTKMNILHERDLSSASKVVNYLLLPCLFISSFGSFLTTERIKENVWVMMFCLLSTFINWVAGWVILKVMQPDSSVRPWCMLGMTFKNMFALPITLLFSVCQQDIGFIDYERSTANSTFVYETADECFDAAEEFVLIYIVFGSFTFWILGYNFASKATVMQDGEKAPPGSNVVDESSIESGSIDEAGDVENAITDKVSRSAARGVKGLYDLNTVPSTKHIEASDKNLFQQFKDIMKRPPVWSMFVGALIGMVPLLRDNLMLPDAELRFTTVPFEVMAQGVVPLINITLGGSLAAIPFQSLMQIFLPQNKNKDSKDAAPALSLRMLLTMMAGPMVILPAVQFFVLGAIFDYTDLIPNNQLLRFVLYVETFSPSANMLIVLATLLHQTAASKTMALMILGQYVISPLTVTGFAVLALDAVTNT